MNVQVFQMVKDIAQVIFFATATQVMRLLSTGATAIFTDVSTSFDSAEKPLASVQDDHELYHDQHLGAAWGQHLDEQRID